ncbi:hypothetical protein M407DRAFT_122945 [Tulasnella calospora MUT 4182]|uniref:Uncharacterized protein n=1 Tax=Tulasnella calospora MUT 4182 TaxID=1051891 RepID=A0A0C3Q4N0_9AGAM|nr:hypothetical protein M407DRAFT_160753 [Tulasnella calospora MUT 4182]KIO21953.1 hypothetical protein M407DRAFT_122945 [Tulasnella calospora MUT 4182]
MLSVDPNYCTHSVLNYIVVSALMMEKKRKEAEKQKRRKDAKRLQHNIELGSGIDANSFAPRLTL